MVCTKEIVEHEYIKGQTLPWFESANLEFKRSLCEAGRDVYLKTICAMLNLDDEGGCILFGVEDDGVVRGFVPSKREKTTIDRLKLMVDSMCDKQLVYNDGQQLGKQEVRVMEKKLTDTEYLVIVFCCRQRKNASVVVATTGEEYCRGNASTLLRDRGSRWVEKPTVHSLLKQEKKRSYEEAETTYMRLLKQQRQQHVSMLEEVERNHIVEIDKFSMIIKDANRLQSQNTFIRTQKRCSALLTLGIIVAFCVQLVFFIGIQVPRSAGL